MAKSAIILLHEIYGKNDFICEMQSYYKSLGYEVVVLDFYNGKTFSYDNMNAAYDYYNYKVGFRVDSFVISLAFSMKQLYEKVFVIGFSVGATLAWISSQSNYIDKTVCIYGSRIRDYCKILPKNETLLLVAKQDSYDVDSLVDEMMEKENVITKCFDAQHGFMDAYSQHFDEICFELAKDEILKFIQK